MATNLGDSMADSDYTSLSELYNKGGTDQRLDRVYVQKDRGGYGPDAGCMTKVREEREQRVRQGPGVTSGLGGRGDLRRSSLGVDPVGKMRLHISNKQTKNTNAQILGQK